jgi:RHS repeat-associated protein
MILIILDNYQIYRMNTIPPSLGLAVAASVMFARALWTQKRNFLAAERTLARVQCRESSLNATAVGRRRAFRSRSVSSRSVFLLPLAALAGTILLASTLPRAFAQGMGGGGTDTPSDGSAYEGPVGVTGIFNGNITTACSYDPLTHNAKRTVTDIVVPGAVGKYPLKMTRYYNSRLQYGSSGLGPGWFHEYGWVLTSGGSKLISPQGSVYDTSCGPPVGVSEYWESGPNSGNGTFRTADGGRVVFQNYGASSIIDPYGLTTTIARDTSGRISTVTEPGGRYLRFVYYTTGTSAGMLQTVEAHDGQGNTTDSVNYTYTSVPSGGQNYGPSNMLTGVGYSDNTSASYGYEGDNVPDVPGPPDYTFKMYPLLDYCNDVRYNGPMREIAYFYQNGGPHGVILKEKNPNVGPISTIAPGLPLRTVPGAMATNFTETRGDGPTRSFTYTAFHNYYNAENDPCLNYEQNNTPGTIAPQQMVIQYTDFQNHTTSLGYDNNWYVNSVTDFNGNTTTYSRGAPPPNGIGQIVTTTLPADASDHTHTIQYGYYSDFHYLHTVTNERAYVTTYTHDTNQNYRLTRIDYPDTGYETLTYDDFNLGLVKTHRLKSTSYQHFQYNSRGLLLAETNPTLNANYSTAFSDPTTITTYSYYTSGPWTDRVLTKTLPRNGSGNTASETYEYDRNSSGTPVAGRGLVTKITHADGTYQSFGYDIYGNKVWQENELRKRTNYAYDSYNRLISATDPLQDQTTYDYSPVRGNSTQCYLHTTSSVYFVTDPVGIITANTYDPSWRKLSTVHGYGSSLAATTSFQYDNTGNLRVVTDPRNRNTTTTYDQRNRKLTVTDALTQTTAWHYGDGINVTSIDRPDGTTETKGYDAMNRVTYEQVPKDGTPGNVTGYTTTQFTYYVSGKVHTVRDGNNHITTFVYNAADLKTDMQYPDFQSNQNDYQHWTWDNAYNLISRRTVNNETQTFSYDNRNRKYAMTWNNQAEWQYFNYDAASRLYTAENGTGTWNTNLISIVSLRYDNAGRLIHDYQNVTGVGQLDVQYTPDADGRVTRMGIPTGIYDQSRSYDALGRLSTIGDQWRGNTIQYNYDAASNVTSRSTLLNGTHITYVMNPYLNRIAYRGIYVGSSEVSSEAYSYDAMNRLYSVYRTGTIEDSKHDSFNYYLDGELNWAQYGASGPGSPDGDGGAKDSDDPGAATGASGGGSSGIGWSEPDGANPGNASVTDDPSPPNSDPTNPSYVASPDCAGTVIDDAASGDQPPPDGDGGGGQPPPDLPSAQTVTYNLDKAGNRSGSNGVVNNSGSISYTPNALNQYINSVGPDPITNGPEHEIHAYQSVTYTYLNDTHLIEVAAPNTDYRLAYDALGRCVKRTLNNGNPTYYIYDGDKPIQEIGPQWASTIYGMGVDEPVIRFTSTDIYYFYQDHEGSVTHVRNNGGTLVERYRYDAFGNPTIMDGNWHVRTVSAIGNRFMFTGREWAAGQWATVNPPLGFYEYRARAYHPGLGRFMSEDPKLFDAGDYNLFRYCHNDPEDLIDPMGLQDQLRLPISDDRQRLLDGELKYLDKLQHALGWSGGAIQMGLVNQAIGQVSQALGGLHIAQIAAEPKNPNARDPGLVRDAVVKALIELKNGKDPESNIRVGDQDFAKIIDRAKIDTKGWTAEKSIHAEKAFESPPLPNHLSLRVKIYDGDPRRGNDNIAVVHPTQSVQHYIDATRFIFGARVNPAIAEQYLTGQ